MTIPPNRELATPTFVPTRLLRILAANNIRTTADIHAMIEAGTLQTLKGIGPTAEKKLISLYTRPKRYRP